MDIGGIIMLHDQIKSLRKQSGITQAQLAGINEQLTIKNRRSRTRWKFL